MAQDNLEYIHLKLSRDIGDEVSSATSNGFNFTKKMREDAINQARLDIYLQFYTMKKPEEFADLFPEYRKIVEVSASAIESGGFHFLQPASIKYIFNVLYVRNSNNIITEKLEEEFYFEALNNDYSVHKPHTDLAKWILKDSEIYILYTSAIQEADKLKVLSLVLPEKINLGDTNDIPEANIFHEAIIKKAVEIIKRGIQS